MSKNKKYKPTCISYVKAEGQTIDENEYRSFVYCGKCSHCYLIANDRQDDQPRNLRLFDYRDNNLPCGHFYGQIGTLYGSIVFHEVAEDWIKALIRKQYPNAQFSDEKEG